MPAAGAHDGRRGLKPTPQAFGALEGLQIKGVGVQPVTEFDALTGGGEGALQVHVPAQGLQIDGFVVLDDQGAEVARWHLQDHWVPTATHPRHGVDVTHSNAISVQDGVALVSIRHLSTVVAIRADPTAKDFGTVLWRLGGYGVDAVWGSDFTLLDATGGSGSFQEQHHAMLLPDGRLSLFDNRIASDADSRALEIELDTGAGTATIVEDYPLPSHCHFQGGSFRTASGHAVTTCAPRGLVYEFAPGTDTISWQTRITCASGSSGVVPRMIPVE